MQQKFIIKIISVSISIFITTHAITQTHTLVKGWNLEGNDNGAAVDPNAIFGNATIEAGVDKATRTSAGQSAKYGWSCCFTKYWINTTTTVSSNVNTVWVWDKNAVQWDFFTPSMTPAALTSYAASKGYGVLTTIQQGQGFWVNAKNAVSVDLTAPADPCTSSQGNEQKFSYNWSLATQQITFTNNTCDKLKVWATSTPLCTGCKNTIIDVGADLGPGQTIVMNAGVPASLSWKPEVIYSLPNNKAYAFLPQQAGSSTDLNFELLLLDHSDIHNGTLSQFNTMYAIDTHEDVRGDCLQFSWTNRVQGQYQITQNTPQVSGYCFVGNITGHTVSGDSVNLPALRYFVTKK